MNDKYHKEGKELPAPSRQLTVYYKHLHRQLSPRGVNVPQIRLIGKWLDETGFEIGKKFTVEHEGDKLILRLTKEPPRNNTGNV